MIDTETFLLESLNTFGNAVSETDLRVKFDPAHADGLLDPLETAALQTAVSAFQSWLAIRAAQRVLKQVMAAAQAKGDN